MPYFEILFVLMIIFEINVNKCSSFKSAVPKQMKCGLTVGCKFIPL